MSAGDCGRDHRDAGWSCRARTIACSSAPNRRTTKPSRDTSPASRKRGPLVPFRTVAVAERPAHRRPGSVSLLVRKYQINTVNSGNQSLANCTELHTTQAIREQQRSTTQLVPKRIYAQRSVALEHRGSILPPRGRRPGRPAPRQPRQRAARLGSFTGPACATIACTVPAPTPKP